MKPCVSLQNDMVVNFVTLKPFFSSGVGRTSIYITLDKVLDQIKAKNIVDIDGVIVKMREQRMKMVRTKVYTYLSINLGKTNIILLRLAFANLSDLISH